MFFFNEKKLNSLCSLSVFFSSNHLSSSSSSSYAGTPTGALLALIPWMASL